ncbi:hypothetical protein ACTOVL_00445 [Arcanobacterium canis]
MLPAFSSRQLATAYGQQTQTFGYKSAGFWRKSGGLVTAHNPHMSPRGGVSGHVSWKPIGDPRFSKMKLTAQLYAWSTFKYWAAGNEDTRVVLPAYKGQTPGANSRAQCRTKAKTTWYTYGTGYAYPAQKMSGYHSSSTSDLDCYPW